MILVASLATMTAPAFPTVLEELEEGPARDIIKQAKSLAEAHSFVLYETLLSRNQACPAP